MRKTRPRSSTRWARRGRCVWRSVRGRVLSPPSPCITQAKILRKMLEDVQMEQVNLGREYQKLLAEREADVAKWRSEAARLGSEEAAAGAAAAATTPSAGEESTEAATPVSAAGSGVHLVCITCTVLLWSVCPCVSVSRHL